MTADANKPDFADALRAFLANQGAAITAHRQVILDSTDPEGVHRMRIAVRRLRSVLRALGFGNSPLHREARWLTDELGVVRDLDVLLERYSDNDTHADYRTHLQAQWENKRAHLKKTLVGERYAAFMQALDEFQRDLAPFDMTPVEAAYKFIGRELKRTKAKGRQISNDSPDAQVHKLRLQCKRLRYLVEMFEHFGGVRLTGFKYRARGLQELLGHFVDERAAALAIADYAQHLSLSEATREVLIDCGRQIKAHELAAAAHRSRLPQVWYEFDTACTRKSLRADLS